MNPSVLIATATHEVKEYSLRRWIDAYQNMAYEPRDVLLVDNSATLELSERWKTETNIMHIQVDGTPHERIGKSMEMIRRYALGRNFDYWLSIECDVIVPANTIEIMLDWRGLEKADFYSMPCPARNNTFLFQNNFCCALFSRELMQKIPFENLPSIQAIDGWFIRKLLDAGMALAGEPPVQLTLEHLSHPDASKDIWW